MNDWRIMDQGKFVMGRSMLKHGGYCSSVSDHQHCFFCYNKLIDGVSDWFSTLDEYYWVCPDCFKDLKDEFNMIVYNDQVPQGSLISYIENYYSQFSGVYPYKRLVVLLAHLVNSSLFDSCIEVEISECNNKENKEVSRFVDVNISPQKLIDALRNKVEKMSIEYDLLTVSLKKL